MTSSHGPKATPPNRQRLTEVTVRLAGDSGDGIQVAGSQLTATSALAGNDVATFPDYPAEIRAPAGTLPGVSGFQLQFSSHDVRTPGDRPDALVAFNPAALRVNLPELKRGGVLIVNEDAFDETSLKKAGYSRNPLDGDELSEYRLFRVPLTRLTREALADSGLTTRQVDRCKNFFALGILYWLYSRNVEPTVGWLREKFARRPELARANEKALRAGYNYAETVGIFQTVYEVPAADFPPGTYRNLDGNEAVALALATVAQKSGLKVVLGSYPITPASTILHRASRLARFGVLTFQAEDEIAAVGAAVGASFAGALGVSTTSGPGMVLKSEIIGLAGMVELPLLVIDVQRAGPSTGMPTKTEQADLLMALYGRHGELPLPVFAAGSPGDCFWTVLEAARVAIRFRTPVIVLSEGYLASGAEPWRVPDPEEIEPIDPGFLVDAAEFSGVYARDPRTLARPWIKPGTPGLEHRIGGLEKNEKGEVSYDPANHERMVRLRAAKLEAIARELPPAKLDQGEEGDDLLVLGWGGTYGAVSEAVARLRDRGRRVASLNLRHLNPLPRGLGELIQKFSKVLVPELNSGQLQRVLEATFHRPLDGLHKIQGQPFRVYEIEERAEAMLGAQP
ncbi:MAG: 2-oxoacid:acceptor oxidoreductase subunit alpha [Acidobacteria bacterium]|nr:MAG: 2-oxoacid:acceptor oxidoreductase subunit alpha [Acidobacteriota bacterium]